MFSISKVSRQFVWFMTIYETLSLCEMSQDDYREE